MDEKISINTKDIAATITEQGFIIGRNNAVDKSIDCDTLEIYTNMRTKGLFDRFKRRPLHVGTLYLKQNGKFSKSWYFDNNYFGEPIDSLKKILEDKYKVNVLTNDKYEILNKEDEGI